MKNDTVLLEYSKNEEVLEERISEYINKPETCKITNNELTTEIKISDGSSFTVFNQIN